MLQIKSFDSDVKEALNNYVYRLIDPRNGETFYVGRGVNDRVFSHANAAVLKSDELNTEIEGSEDELSLKYSRIREIIASGLEVIHIIHRHGMDVDEAKLVEAVLIDAYPGLTNIMGGEGSDQYGPANAIELQQRYKKQEIEFEKGKKFILINIKNSIADHNILDATRYAWVLNIKKAEQADYVLAESKGIIRGVFKPKQWYNANDNVFTGFPSHGLEEMRKRSGFEAMSERELREKGMLDEYNNSVEKYMGKRTPLRKKGQACPIRYFNF